MRTLADYNDALHGVELDRTDLSVKLTQTRKDKRTFAILGLFIGLIAGFLFGASL